MKPREQLEQLIQKGREICKDPLKDKLSTDEICIYATLKSDITLANMALTRNSQPLILHYIEKLKLHLGEPDATEKSKDIG